MTTGQLVLEYFKVFLATPVVAGAVALTFIGVFREHMGRLIDRIASIKLPGGELSAPQLPAEPVRDAPKELTGPDEEVPAFPAQPTSDDIKRFESLLQSEKARAYLWEYRYLNMFLAPRTLAVLDWLASVPTQSSESFYDSLWSHSIPEAPQRSLILDVLSAHHLVARDGGILSITDKGREYLAYKDKI